MRNLISRINAYNEFEIVYFGDESIARDVEEWPECDCLIGFASKGFPLEKGIKYAGLI